MTANMVSVFATNWKLGNWQKCENCERPPLADFAIFDKKCNYKLELKLRLEMVCGLECVLRTLSPSSPPLWCEIICDESAWLTAQYGQYASLTIYIWNIHITSFISRLPYIVTIGFKSISNCDDVCSADSNRDDECSRHRSSWCRIVTIMLTTQWLVIESVGLVVSIIITIWHRLEWWREHSLSRFESAEHYGHNSKSTWNRMRPLW